MSQSKKKSNQSDSEKFAVVLCENPKTGRVEVRCKGSCPTGWIEHLRDKATTEGVDFVIPKVRTVYEDEDDAEESTDESTATAAVK